MSDSLRNSKDNTLSKVNKEVNEYVVRKLKFQSKKAGDSRTKTGSSARALKVRKPCVAKKMRRLQMSPDSRSDYGSDADEIDFDWSNFLNRCAFFLEEFGEGYVKYVI